MAKLHELLAAESARRKTASEMVEETLVTFHKKPDRLVGRHSVYESLLEDDPDNGASDTKVLDTTVRQKLDWTFDAIVASLDVMASKDATNAEATADLIVEVDDAEFTLCKGVPGVTLLALEKQVASWRDLLLSIPTLAPGRAWEEDGSLGAGIYRDTHPDRKARTKRETLHKILDKATPEHPAQIHTWAEDVTVGHVVTETTSGMLPPAKKADLLARLDALLIGIKAARQRANSQEVIQMQIGRDMVDFLLDGPKASI